MLHRNILQDDVGKTERESTHCKRIISTVMPEYFTTQQTSQTNSSLNSNSATCSEIGLGYFVRELTKIRSIMRQSTVTTARINYFVG